MNYESLLHHDKHLQTFQHEVSETIKSAVHIQSKLKISVRFQSLLTSSLCQLVTALLPKTQSLLKLQHLAFAKLSILLDHVNGGPNAKLTPFEYCNPPVFDHLPIASLQRLIAVGREVFLLCLGSSLWFDRLNPNKRHPKSQSFQSRFWWRSAC